MNAHPKFGLVVGTLFSGWVLACGGASAVAVPPEYAPPGQTKCSIAKSSTKPLIVEWPSADRMELESRVKSGTVVVAYSGCEMRVLSRCRAPGAYAYVAGTPKSDSVAIRDADELYAMMPAGAARFEGRLQKSGQLNVAMTLVGRYESQKAEVNSGELVGDCRDATHVVSALTVGAFEFFAGADASVLAGAGFASAEAGAKSSQRRESLVKDGNPEACLSDAELEGAPPRGCSALIRLEVVPVVLQTAFVQPPPAAVPPAAVPPATVPLAVPPPAASAPPTAPAPAVSKAHDASPKSTDGNGFLPDPLGFQVAMMVGVPPKVRKIPSGTCEQSARQESDQDIALGLLAGAHWDLSPKVSISANGELASAPLYGATLGTTYRISRYFVATGGVGVDWTSYESTSMDCTVELNWARADYDGSIPIGFVEAGMQVHYAGEPPHASGWFGATLRGGASLDVVERRAETGGSIKVDSPPGVTFFGLFGSNF